MIIKVQIKFVFLLFWVIFGIQEAMASPAAKPEESFEQAFIRGDIVISQWLDSVADGLDLFLAGGRVTKKKNETSVRLENSVYSTEGDNLKNSTGLGINLRLPNLEEHWRLKFTTFDENEEKRNAQAGYLRLTPRRQSNGATVGFFQKLGTIRTAFEPRIDLQDPLRVSHSLSFQTVVDMASYEINPKLEFYAAPDKGTGIYMGLHFYFGLSETFSLTLINSGDYEEKKHQLSCGNGISLGQVINQKTSMSYGFSTGSNNRTNYHLEYYSFSVAWNRLIYKRVLETQVVPHWDFTKDKSFRGAAGLVVNLSLIF